MATTKKLNFLLVIPISFVCPILKFDWSGIARYIARELQEVCDAGGRQDTNINVSFVYLIELFPIG